MMLRILGALGALLLISGSGIPAWAAPAPVSSLCDELLQKAPDLRDYAAVFTPEFRADVPLEKLKSTFGGLYAVVGKCVSYQLIPISGREHRLILTGESGIAALLRIYIRPESGLLSGLYTAGVDDPAIRIGSWNDLPQAFHRLDPDGTFAATLVTGDHRLIFEQAASQPLSIASTFKLYILGALQTAIAAGQHSWNEILPIHEEWKSFPSGVMHEWTAGKEVTLSEYAEKMISISDNTAADHLLYFLGRERVEEMLTPMGNQHAFLDLPLFSTLELFKLKWAISPSETDRFIQSDQTERRAILESLTQVPRSAVGTNGVPFELPSHVNQLGWFATTSENCEAMFWLAAQESSEIRKALSISAPFGGDSGHWTYRGYKGGSDSGVLSMTYLLESVSGTRACLSMTWNNSIHAVSSPRFQDVMRKTIKLAEILIP